MFLESSLNFGLGIVRVHKEEVLRMPRVPTVSRDTDRARFGADLAYWMKKRRGDQGKERTFHDFKRLRPGVAWIGELAGESETSA